MLLTLEQILELHVLAVRSGGGSTGLRDMGRLEAAIAAQSQAVFGEELYKTMFDKAAVVCRGIVADHPFVDGNKRTAMLAALTLLKVNDYELVIPKGQLEDFAVRIAVEHLSIQDIAAWFERYSVATDS